MPTKASENYLKTLYHLHLKSAEISLSELGQKLEVSKPTVNDMVKKMHQKGWVHYEKYKPVRLTDEGRRNAALVIRKHRLAEMFLSQIMGFGWEEVHDIAEELEHLKSENLFDRMDELLGFPSVDPHGSPIPDKSGEIVKHEYKALVDYPVGTQVILKALRDSSTDFLIFLNKKELQLGATIHIHQIESFDKSVTVSYGSHKNVVLTEIVCKKLLVTPFSL